MEPMTTTPLLQGFPPVVDDGARLLILGSFPSVQSLELGQYYANPRNAFWRITGQLFTFDVSEPYQHRLAVLRSNGIALWDVLYRCRRRSSADAAIDPKSSVVNDFDTLFSSYPGLTRVYFNGATAATTFRRLVDVESAVTLQQLPSTSPAHTMPLRDKLRAWQVISSS
jgi:hypoxanthine-DNA glycosylase